MGQCQSFSPVSPVLGDDTKPRFQKLLSRPGARLLALGMLVVTTLAVAIPSFTLAALDTPQILSYQGRLTDAQKVTVADGSKTMKFAIYDASSGGTCVWSAGNTDANAATIDCPANVPAGTLSITVTDGLFNVLLGDTTGGLQNSLPDSLFNTTSPRYLEITINGETLTPRRRLVSSATALQAGNASLLDGFDTSQVGGSSAFVPVTDSSGNLTLNSTQNAATSLFIKNASTGNAAKARLDMWNSNSQGLRLEIFSTGHTASGLQQPNMASLTSDPLANGLILGTAGAADPIIFGTFNTERMRLDGSGNVGIGTASPITKLELGGNHVNNRGLLYLNGTDYSYAALEAPAAGESGFFFNRGGVAEWIIGIQGSGGSGDKMYFSEGVDLTTGARMTLVAGGNVGIGDTSPASLFTVGSGDTFQVNSSGNLVKVNNVSYSWPASQGASSTVLTNDGAGNLSWSTSGGSGDITAVGSMTSGDVFADATADDDWLGLGASAGRIEFDDQATDEVNILNANVGIGTTSPGSLLTVNQTVTATSGTVSMHDDTITVSPTGASTAITYAAIARAILTGSQNASEIQGVYDQARHDGSGTLSNQIAFTAQNASLTSGSAVTTSASGGLFRTTMVGSGTWTVTTNKTVNISKPEQITGTLNGTNLYGLYVDDFSTPGGTWTNKFAIYSEGGTNYFGGNVGIGDTSPAALLTVGSGDKFRVDSSGNLIRVNDVAYSWPASQGASSTVLTNDGAGNLSWSTSGGSGDITAVGSMTSGDVFADATADDDWLGLGASAGRIEFDDQTTDEVNILSARLGIGDSTPSFPLELNASLTPNATFADNSNVLATLVNTNATSNAWGALKLMSDEGTGIWFSSENDSGTHGYIRTQYTGSMYFGTGSDSGAASDRMVIDASGNVGIGTTPTGRFEVNHSTNNGVMLSRRVTSGGPSDAVTYGASLSLTRPENGVYVHDLYSYDTAGNAKNNLALNTRSDFVILNNNIESVRILENSFVGIGTSAPTEKLTVAAGTLGDGRSAGLFTATMPAFGQTANMFGLGATITSNGSSSFSQTALYGKLLHGYTGSLNTVGVAGENQSSTTATGSPLVYGTSSAFGVHGFSRPSSGTTGNRTGGYFQADTGTANNVGVQGLGWAESGMTGSAYGVIGMSLPDADNIGTGYGGWFQVDDYAGFDFTAGAALVANNGASGLDIFRGLSNGTQVFTVADGGKVGIGTTSPNYVLDIVTGSGDGVISRIFSNTASDRPIIVLNHNRGTSGTPTAVQSGDNLGELTWAGSVSGQSGVGSSFIRSSATENWVGASAIGSKLQFYTVQNGTLTQTQRMVIDNNGQVGFGMDPKSSPGYTTDVNGSLGVWNAAATSQISLERSNGTLTSPTALSAGNVIGSLRFVGYTDARNDGASIQAIAATGYGASGADSPAHLTFSTTPDGSGTLVERMRIDSSGNVGIGTTNPGGALTVNGVIRSYNDANGYGSINLENTASGTFDGFQFRKDTSTLWAAKSVSSGNDLAFYVDNTSSRGVYIKTGGNVGIGRTNPGSLLTVGASNGLSGTDSGKLLYVAEGTTSTRGMRFENSLATLDFVASTDGNAYVGTFSNNNLGIITNNLVRALIDSTGNVGIGDTTPAALFTVGNGDLFQVNSNGQLTMNTASGVQPMTINSDYGGSLLVLNDTGATNDAQMLMQSPAAFITMLSGNTSGSNGGGNTGNSLFVFKNDHDLIFSSATNSGLGGLANRMTIRGDNGNVGIGTTAPQSLLHVRGTTSYGSIRNSPSSDNGESGIGFFQDAAGTDTNDAWVVGQGGWGNTGDFTVGNENNGAGGTVRLLIEKAGNVGIGVTSPSAKLHVHTDAASNDIRSSSFNDGTATTTASITLLRGDGTWASPTAIDSGDYLGRIQFAGQSGTGLSDRTVGAYIDAIASENWANSTNSGTYLSFLTSLNGTFSLPTERMRITDAGDVGIGTVPNTSAKLHVAGNQIRLEGTSPDMMIINTAGGTDLKISDIRGTGTTVVGRLINDANSAATTWFQVNRSASAGTPVVDSVTFPNGNVGIGDTSPAALFTVGNGDLFQVNSSGRVQANVGASGAGNLAYSFVGDTDTGLYRSAANEMRFQTSGSDRITIDSIGNVGIGIATPTATLHINDTSSGSGVSSTTLILRNDSNDDPQYNQMVFQGVSAFEMAGIRAQHEVGIGDTSIRFLTHTGSPGALNERMTIQADGSVGIGTTAPGALLDVRGSAVFNEASANADFRIESDNNANMFFLDASSDSISIGTSFSDPNSLLVIDSPTSTTSVERRVMDVGGLLHNITAGITDQRYNVFSSSLIAAATSQTVTNAATVYVSDAPQAGTNVTITNPYALWVDAGTTRFDGGITFSSASGTRTERLCQSGGGTGDGVTLTDASIGDCSAAGQADYAEQYPVATGITYGDIVMLGATNVTTTGGDTIKQLVKTTAPYASGIIGVVSNNYGDPSSIGYNIAPGDNPMPVALNGRVLVNVNDENGAISAGDPITSSSTAGEGMKATKPGMIIGRAISSFAGPGSGTVMVFIHPEYYVGATLTWNGGVTTLEDSLTIQNNLTVSGAISLNSATAGNTSITKVPRLASGTCGSGNAEGWIFQTDSGVQVGHACIEASGTDQMKWYAESFNGTGTDVAESYNGKAGEVIQKGDVVALDVTDPEDFTVTKATNTNADFVLGIVSTRPGVTLSGVSEDGTRRDNPRPIMVGLAGRVPTKVTDTNGPISKGDFLTVSATPGVAMKWLGVGPIIGRALRPHAQGTGVIEVFIQLESHPGANTASQVSTTTSRPLQIFGDLDFASYSITNIRAIRGMNWSIGEDGSLVVNKVSTQEIVIRNSADKQTIGSGEVPAGQTSAIISNASIQPNSKIFISWRGIPGWIANQSQGAFTVQLINPSATVTQFDYWIVQVEGDTVAPVAPAAAPAQSAAPTTSDPLPPAETTQLTQPATTTTPTEPATTTTPTEPAQVIVQDPAPAPTPAPDPAPTLVSEPVPVEPAPAESAPVEPAPADSVPDAVTSPIISTDSAPIP